MSVDMSPKSDVIVFDLLGRIYQIPIGGGGALDLTANAGVSINLYPRFSPDGSKIAFVSDRGGAQGLWVMDADGANPELIFQDDSSMIIAPTWAPDGNSIAATRALLNYPSGFARTSQVWLFPLNGGAPRHVTKGSGDAQTSSPSFSPDGGYLYFHGFTRPVAQDALFKLSLDHLVRGLDLKKGGFVSYTPSTRVSLSKRIDSTRGFQAAEPRVSPNGRYLAYVRRNPAKAMAYREQTYYASTALWVRDLETGEDHVLLDGVTLDQFEVHAQMHQRFTPGYSWAPDGASIIITRQGKIQRVAFPGGDVSDVPFEVQVIRDIAPPVKAKRDALLSEFNVRFARFPALSPDAEELLFEAVGKLWRKKGNNKPQRLTDQNIDGQIELAPAWSEDGARIAYVAYSDEKGGHIWTQNANGHGRNRVSQKAGVYLDVEWAKGVDALYAVRAHGGVHARSHAMRRTQYVDIIRFDLSTNKNSTVKIERETLLKRLAYSNADGQAWPNIHSTDDGRLFYAASAGAVAAYTADGYAGTARAPSIALFSIDANGDDERVHGYFPYSTDVVISPKGNFVAFRESNDVYLASLDAGKPDKAYFYNVHDASLRIERLSERGGIFPHWSRKGVVGFFDGDAYVSYNALTKEKTSNPIDLRVEPDYGRGEYALKNMRIITLNESDEVIRKGSVVVSDGKIQCLGDCDLRNIESVFDMGGKTVMPGIIDAHCHAGSRERGFLRPKLSYQAVYLAYGVTTCVDPAGPPEDALAQGEWLNAGSIIGPRYFATTGVVKSWGEHRLISSYEDALRVAEQHAAWGAFGLKSYFQLRRDQRQWLVEAVRKQGTLSVMPETLDLFHIITAIYDGHTTIEHMIPQLPIYKDVSQLFGQSGVTFVPTTLSTHQGRSIMEYFRSRSDIPNDPREKLWTPWEMRMLSRRFNFPKRPLSDYSQPILSEGIKDILAAGGNAAIGAHGNQPGVDSHWDMWSMGFALDPMETLKLGTIRAAETHGLDDQIGSIEVGKVADLAILEESPLKDIENTLSVSHVAKSGRLYRSETLEQLWPTAKPYGQKPWLQEGVDE